MNPLNDGRPSSDSSIVVIGLGNPYRCDDAVGVEFSRRIEPAVPPDVAVVESDGEPATLMAVWEGAGAVFIVDAVHTRDARRVFRFDAHDESLPVKIFRISTHAMGVAEAIGLARSIGEIPATFIVYGIRGERFDHGTSLSPAVDKACDEVVGRVLEDIRMYRSGGDGRASKRT
jgi:hydrogenase maturation protease